MRAVLSLLVLLLVAVSAVHAGVVFQRTQVPKGWSMLGAAPASASVSFTLGLVTRNTAELESLFWSVSDPDSADYLQYLSSEQVEARYGADEADRVQVRMWLLKAGVTDIRSVSSALYVTTTAATAARLFNTEMRSFRHQQSGATVIKAWGAYSLPEHVHSRVRIVTGISSFPVPGKPSPFKRPTAAAPPAKSEAVVPQTLTRLYNIRPQAPGSVSGADQGVIEYSSQYFNNNDTARFAADVGYNTTDNWIRPIPAEHVVGKNVPSQPGIESTLDVQMIAAVNMEVDTWFWIEDGQGWLYEFGTHLLNATTRPQVTSTSYGWWEGDQCAIDGAECQQLGVDSYGYTAAVNELFQKIGVVGVSLLVASGDSGANGRTDEACTYPTLRPEFPASSPYVTTVGATEIRNATYLEPTTVACQTFSCVEDGIEVAVSLPFSAFTSGGGFSNVSGANRPRYQTAAVHAYLNSGVRLPNASSFNEHGRGEPDVSAVGHNGFIAYGGQIGLVGGTSMSSPIFAGVVSLLNTIAVNKTGQTLGFLNPLLYKMAAAEPDTFHDVTEGDNICPEYGCRPSCQGYYATKGWDPVTGLGTPNAGKMEAYVSQLMDKTLSNRQRRQTVAQQ